MFLAVNARADTGAKWRFVVFGDSRSSVPADQINTAILGELAREITNQRPAFVLFSGDLVYTGDLAAFRQWTNILARVSAAGIGVYPVMGNHDIPDVDGFLEVFGGNNPGNGPPGEVGRTFALVCSNALVLGLDAYSSAHRVNQAWIDSVLATNTLPHVFAFAHEPAFKVYHLDCLDDYPAQRDVFWQSLSNARCRVYFAGHDHFYDHMRLDDGDGNPDNDVHQLIAGTGGAPLHSDGLYNGSNGSWTPVRILHEQQFGYVVVEIEGLNASATWWRRTSAGTYAASTDVFSWAVPPPPGRLAFSFSGMQLTLTWTAGTLQSTPDLMDPFADVPGASSPHVITNFSQPQRHFRLRRD